MPATVAAQSSIAAALWDNGYQVDVVYGELTETDGELDYQAGDIDLSQVEVVGRTYGELDVQQLGVLAPELLVDYTFDDETLWYVPSRSAKQVENLTQTLGIGGQYTTTDEAIQTFLDLAGELGADTGSDDLVADEEAYRSALEQLGATAEESGLQVAFVSADVDAGTFYVANPGFFPELGTLGETGLDIVEPKSGDPIHFHAYSWEQVADYSEADVLFFDARVYDLVRDKLDSIDTWTSHPAVEAGQVFPWYAAAPYSYRAYGEVFQEMADALAGSEPVE
ncbi:ABC transporter substrate-binding protein [Nocardioides sp. TF02-7]|uniref:ABC transporter substrate-binding protein n=1 Tax=Nocardioides sp. TF02-7 TaxID=2917724 RepID=UPI001F052E4A|nr:ABC transporter substrate-binding protein [Nocardioides sp. TF02-7]UMG94375.1 ABC transporter substrate-binding protein [Nocardioides sp. TF02-7]